MPRPRAAWRSRSSRDETQAELRAILPAFAATANPIDITAALLTNSRLFGDILPVIAKDPAADAFFVGIPVAGRAYDVEAFARDTAAFAERPASRSSSRPRRSSSPTRSGRAACRSSRARARRCACCTSSCAITR